MIAIAKDEVDLRNFSSDKIGYSHAHDRRGGEWSTHIKNCRFAHHVNMLLYLSICDFKLSLDV